MDDYNYLPTESRVPAGKEVSLIMIHTGRLFHEWVIMKTPVASPFADKDEPNVFLGEGSQAEHIEHGMKGKWFVHQP